MDYLQFFSKQIDNYIKEPSESGLVDRLTYKVGPLLLLGGAFINILKFFINNVITCYTKAEFPRGWNEYTNDYCFVENTYYLYAHEPANSAVGFRKDRQVAYYQWVPYILATQAFFLYLPIMLFRSFNWISGYPIKSLIGTAKYADRQINNNKDRNMAIKRIARSLFNAHSSNHVFFLCLRNSYFVTSLYVIMRITILFILVGNLFVYGFFTGSYFYPIESLSKPWESTGHFPRVTLCDVPMERFGAPMNFTMECLLPLNMYNEKLFGFYYFVMLFLFFLNLGDLFLLGQKISNRQTIFQKTLTRFLKKDENWRAAVDPNAHVNDRGITIHNTKYSPDLLLVLYFIRSNSNSLTESAVFRQLCFIDETEGQTKSKPSVETSETRPLIEDQTGDA